MIGRVQRAALALLAGIALLWVAWVAGRREGTQKAQTDAQRKTLKSYIETRSRIDETNLGDDPDVLRDFLRARDPSKR